MEEKSEDENSGQPAVLKNEFKEIVKNEGLSIFKDEVNMKNDKHDVIKMKGPQSVSNLDR